VLLERIRKEKERLVKEGKIKKSKSSASSDKPPYENVPFEVPEGWEWCDLKTICRRIVDGDHNPPNGLKNISPYIMASSKNISGDDLTNLNDVRYLSYEDFIKADSRTKVSIGDILFTSVGSIGRSCVIKKRINITFQRSVTIIDTVIKNEYVKYFFDSPYFQNHVISNAKGTAQKGFYLNQMEESLVAIPPIAEQNRIVESIKRLYSVLDILENCRDGIATAINQAKSKILDLAIHGKLVPQDPNDEPASAMLKRLGITSDNRPYENVPFEIPGSWSWTCMDELNKYKSISVDPGKEPNADYELYSVPNFETGMPEFVKGKDVSSAKKSVVKNDVLLCKINPHLNRAWVVPHIKKDLRCIASSEWIVFRNEETNPEYMKMCFTSPYFKELMLSNVSGVGGSLMRAQPASVGKYLFPLPPLDEQIRIVSKVNELILQLENIEQSLQE